MAIGLVLMDFGFENAPKVKPRMSTEKTTENTHSKFGMNVKLLILCSLVEAVFEKNDLRIHIYSPFKIRSI